MNDLVRWLAGLLVRPLAWLSARMVRVARFRRGQERLRRLYGVASLPVAGWGPETEAALLRVAPGPIATTSGTTAEPKRVPYSRARMRAFSLTTAGAGVRAFAHHRIARADMFVLAGTAADDSFTSLVVRGRPSWLRGLIEPHRWLAHPDIVALTATHGLTASRLWLIALSDPAMLYATNPSTLASFLDEIQDWDRAAAVIRTGLRFGPTGRSSADRLTRLAAMTRAPPIEVINPSLRGFVCWDGGYVRPYLERVRRYLPADRYVHIPMYSMSTETLQTLPVGTADGLRYLACAPGVLYEFLDANDVLVAPWELEVGSEYTMVVSDRWGLRRYDTADVFVCEQGVGDCPGLRFVRRRGLAWSFTGEKLTGEQVELAFATLREDEPRLRGMPMSCLPTRIGPGYVLVIGSAEVWPPQLAGAFDRALASVNAEYRSKRESGRLAAPRLEVLAYAELAARLDRRTTTEAAREARTWESQFKLNPLTTRVWEEVG